MLLVIDTFTRDNFLGLDTFTARHIVETLQDLARSGRTVRITAPWPFSGTRPPPLFIFVHLCSAASQSFISPPSSLALHPLTPHDNPSIHWQPAVVTISCPCLSQVILSIHQPRYDVFALLDDVIVLSRGKQVWGGGSKALLKHLTDLGYPCPALVNPADFILDISSIDVSRSISSPFIHSIHSWFDIYVLICFFHFSVSPSHHRHHLRWLSPCFDTQFRDLQREEVSDNRLKELVRAYGRTIASNNPSKGASGKDIGNEPQDLALSLDDEAFAKSALPLYVSLPLLLQRSYLNQSRQPVLMSTRISQGLFFALILCCYYSPMGNDQASVQNRIGNLQQTTSLCFIGMLNNIAIFPLERNVFYREYVDGTYSTAAFFLSYFLLSIPFILLSAVCIAVLFTYAIGLRPEFGAFLIFTYVTFCFMFVGECVGVAFCALFFHIGFSVNIMSVVISIFCVMAGFLSESMPYAVQVVNYISPMKWGAWIVMNVAFQGLEFSCEGQGGDNVTSCVFQTGEDVIDLYHMDARAGNGGLSLHLGVLGGVTLAFFALSYVVLRIKTMQLSH